MNTELLAQLNRFLGEASRATYAGDGHEVESWRKGFKELEYQNGAWYYRDSYTGHFQSWGEEVVWYENKPVWTALYGGGMAQQFHGDTTFAERTFNFLKAALSTGEKSLAFQPRGPKSFADGDWAYACTLVGDISKFHGHESITFQSAEVFMHDFMGGLVI